MLFVQHFAFSLLLIYLCKFCLSFLMSFLIVQSGTIVAVCRYCVMLTPSALLTASSAVSTCACTTTVEL